MSSKSESVSSPLDTALLVVAVLVLAGSIFGFYYVKGEVADPVRVIGILVGAAIAVVIALQTQLGRLVWSYLQGSRTELRKVVWPTRKETAQTTLIILFVVLLVGVFMWGLDAILLWGVQALTGARS